MNAARLIVHQKSANRSHLYVGHHGLPEPPRQIILDDLFREPMQAIITRPKDEHFMLSDLARKFPHLKPLIFTLYGRHIFTISMQKLIREQLTIGNEASAALLIARDLVRSLNDVWSLHIHGYSSDDVQVAQELVEEIIQHITTLRKP